MPGNLDFFSPDFDYHSLSPEQRGIVVRRIIRRAQADRAEAIRGALRIPVRWLWNAAVGAVAAVARSAATYARERRCRQGIAELQSLTDRDLKDIGVRRSEIYWVVHHGRERPDLRVQEKPRPIVMAGPAAKPVRTVAQPKRPATATKSAA
jgi:uncharacterized protein YjiS (DUF1127 family)